MQKLLSLDTSSTSTGYSIYADGVYQTSGCLDLKKYKLDKPSEMIRQLFSLIENESPDIIVAEEMAVTRNAKTFRVLTMILGAVYGKCIEQNIKWDTLRPTEWRAAVRGKDEKLPRSREELKKWSKNKVKELFGIQKVNDDVSDSILIGQAYINKYKD